MVLEMMEHILPGTDPALVRPVKKELRGLGVEIHNGASELSHGLEPTLLNYDKTLLPPSLYNSIWSIEPIQHIAAYNGNSPEK